MTTDFASNPPAEASAPVAHKRRPRYAGKHPRRFEEKYKERNAEKYPETAAKVLASGKTPAGTHRPIMVAEILEVLAPQPGEIAVDCTLGYGGHALEILRRLHPGGRLIGLDADPIELAKTTARLRDSGFAEAAFAAANTNFAALPQVLAERNLPRADCLLADLGVSSMQLDDPARGFSHKADGPLDLRLNPRKGRSGAEVLAALSVEKLAGALRELSDEPRAEEIAAAIFERQQQRPIHTTFELAGAVRAGLPRSQREEDPGKTLSRVFQALRILVNDELGVLGNLLRVAPDCLAPGGRIAILTFHSGEDRRVKQSFEHGLRAGVYAAISQEPLRPAPAEVHANPRSSSAKLRWAIRAGG